MRQGLPALLLALPLAAAAQPQFLPPEPITGTEQTYRFSRTASNLAAFDGEGRLHVTYFAGEEVTNPTYPSYIYHRAWSPQEGWSEETLVDRSLQGATRIGGRHPSLTISQDGTVWIVWQDHRHGTPTFNYIDNNELYANSKSAGGEFAAQDIRLTTTNAGPPGDNAYAPRIVTGPAGRLHIAWYDFHANPSVADLYIKASDPSTVFDLSETMESMRLTWETERDGSPSFTVPDLAIGPDGTRHLTWTTGSGAIGDLYYGSLSAESMNLEFELLAPGVASYFDPPRIDIGPDGSVWIANGDGADQVALRRKPPEAASFGTPIVLTSQAVPSAGPSMAFDSEGRMHIAWIGDPEGVQVMYGIFDPEEETLVEEIIVSGAAGFHARPVVMLTVADEPFIMWERQNQVAFPGGSLWFTRLVPPSSACPAWQYYY